MAVLGILAVIFMMSFIIESLVEVLFGQAVSHLPILQPYAWLLMYVASIVGVIGAFLYGFDLLYLLGNYLAVPVDVYPIMASPTWFGTLLTGLAIGRGSNYLHDLVAKFFVKPSGAAG